MKRGFVDLHLHTTASDGTWTPGEVVERAIGLGFSAIGIADHDTANGLDPALQAVGERELEIVPAVELSASEDDTDVHILGYLIDYHSPKFTSVAERLRQARYERGVKMVEKLNELGIGIKMETVKDIAGEASIGRPHVADALLRGEYVRSYDEAFARYLGYHAPAYVPKYRLSPEEAIDLIHSVNGLAVIAHPGLLHRDDLIPKFVELGLDGLEAFHPQHGYYVTNHYIDLAKRYGLLYTGGSDCHGERKGRALIGTVKMPYSCLEALRRRRKELGKGRAGNLAV